MKKILLLIVLFSSIVFVNAQNTSWLIGDWKGIESSQSSSKSRFTRTITISSVSGENFTGTKTNQVNDAGKAKIITSVSGYLNNGQIYLQNGAVLYKKQPSNGEWWDCSSCTPQNAITIQQKRIVLTSRISGCQKDCDGVSVYYRSLCEFDSLTQRYLVSIFGKSSDIASFKPCTTEQPEIIVASDPDKMKNETKIAQQSRQRIQDSLKTAAAIEKKRKQEIEDSLHTMNIAEQKRQQQVNDSINTAKQQAQKKIQDSLRTAAAIEKKRKQEIEDSTKQAVFLAKKRQQEIEDSVTTEANAAKKRQQELDDSLTLVKRKEQQKLQDSLKLSAVLAKKRKQEIEDSIKNAELIETRKQQAIADSLNTALIAAKKREKQISDSLSIVKKKEQQKLQDSLKTAAAYNKKRKQEIEDSTKNAAIVAKKRQQAIDDSLQTVAASQKRLQRYDDSVKNATAKNAAVVKDTAKASTTKALKTRSNVLLESYHINTPDILIELFDNAQIDGDRVSVYHNNNLIVNNKMLLKEPITFKVHADSNNRVHEFIMIAENLGAIAPNTALMRITAGKDTYKLSVRTDLQTNAKIVFYYDGN